MSDFSKGFMIKCNECGRENVLTMFNRANNNISVARGYGSTEIACDCGNGIDI